jgi:hypothetical protein
MQSANPALSPEMHDDADQSDPKHRQDEEVEWWIKPGVMGKI